jgi:hypothetical protein
VVGVVLALFATDCSFAFVRGPAIEERPYPQGSCTTINVAPVLDVMIAGLQGVRLYYAATASEADYRDATLSQGADMTLTILLGSLAFASAVYGFSTTADCRAGQRRVPK